MSFKLSFEVAIKVCVSFTSLYHKTASGVWERSRLHRTFLLKGYISQDFCYIFMALEDVCQFKNTLVNHKWLTDDCNLEWRTFRLNQNIPLNLSLPSHSTFHSNLLHKPIKRPFPLTHGTTTLGFIYQGGVIAAADTRASAGGLVACPSVSKITPIHSHLVVTSSGSGADCMLWERILKREIRLYQLRHNRRLSIRGTAKLLSFMLHPFKGTDVCVALILCGWDKATTDTLSGSVLTAAAGDAREKNKSTPLQSGPSLIYVCSDGARLHGSVFSVGSGSPYAYGILDEEMNWRMNEDEAISVARQAVFGATHRDAYSGNNVDIFHVTAEGWSQQQREDLKEKYYQEKGANNKE